MSSEGSGPPRPQAPGAQEMPAAHAGIEQHITLQQAGLALFNGWSGEATTLAAPRKGAPFWGG